MSWLEKNSYIKVLFTAFLLIVAFVLITDDGKTTYEQIEIQHGDTLWALAEQYRGSMSIEDWILSVKVENNINGEKIVAGHNLIIPISEEAVNIAQKSEDEEFESVKVASKNQ